MRSDHRQNNVPPQTETVHFDIRRDMIKSIMLALCVIVFEIVLYFVYYQRI